MDLNVDRQYLSIMKDILENGNHGDNRTGVSTRSLFGRMMNIDMTNGFPLLTTKKIHTKSVIHELLWFLKGDTNVKYLQDNGVRIWNEWADENGHLGPVYGKQWVNLTYIDNRTDSELYEEYLTSTFNDYLQND